MQKLIDWMLESPDARPTAQKILDRVVQLLPVEELMSKIELNLNVPGQRLRRKLLFTQRSGQMFKKTIFVYDVATGFTK